MNILLIVNGNSGLQYHRQSVPHEVLKAKYSSDVTWSFTMEPEKLDAETLQPFDIVHVLREAVKSQPQQIRKDRKGNYVVSPADGEALLRQDQKVIDTIKEAGKKLVFDIDDNWQLPTYHGLWDSNRAFAVEKRTNNILKQADAVTTTTQHFADYISTVTGSPVHVLPNAIDKKDPQWNKVNITSPLVRFGWIGGTHHREDIKLLQTGISQAYRELDGFQFCLSFNYNDEYLHHEKIFSNNYNVTDDYRKYLIDQLNQIRAGKAGTFVGEHFTYHQPYRRLWSKPANEYGTLYNEIDVSLVPLRSNNFNKYKSELKLVEAGAMGKAAIVTRVKPYDHFPEECIHFVNENDMNEGWIDAIDQMMNKDYRDQKAKNLEEYCNEHYDVEKIAEKRYKLYCSLL